MSLVELREMIKSIRNLETALGDGVKAPSAGEMSNREIARKSLVASREIKTGDLFSRGKPCGQAPWHGYFPDALGRNYWRKISP